MEEELSGFQVDPAVSDGTPESGRRSGKEFEKQREKTCILTGGGTVLSLVRLFVYPTALLVSIVNLYTDD